MSRRIISDNQTVIVEDLNVKGMLENSRLAKHIADASWGKLIKVDRFFPSSKLCSKCGYKNEGLKLSDRKWTCPKCGTERDRDVNAAVNLLKEGLTHLKKVVGVDCPELMPVEEATASYETESSSLKLGEEVTILKISQF